MIRVEWLSGGRAFELVVAGVLRLLGSIACVVAVRYIQTAALPAQSAAPAHAAVR